MPAQGRICTRGKWMCAAWFFSLSNIMYVPFVQTFFEMRSRNGNFRWLLRTFFFLFLFWFRKCLQWVGKTGISSWRSMCIQTYYTHTIQESSWKIRSRHCRRDCIHTVSLTRKMCNEFKVHHARVTLLVITCWCVLEIRFMRRTLTAQ